MPEYSFRPAGDAATESFETETSVPDALVLLLQSPPDSSIRPISRRFGVFDRLEARLIFVAVASAAPVLKRALEIGLGNNAKVEEARPG